MRFRTKKAVILAMAVITVFLLAHFAARGSFQFPLMERLAVTIMAPFDMALSSAGHALRQVTGAATDVLTVYQDNQALKMEIQLLRQNELNVTEIMAENVRLQTMLDYKQKSPQFDFVIATVISRDPGNWTNTIIINKGASDGLAKDMPVVTSRGLAGNIVQVFPGVSKVQLLLDPRSAVGSIVQRPESRVAAIVEGNSVSPMLPRMINLARDADILPGDRIITSGFGGIYPKGILVGDVLDVINDEGGLLKFAVLHPAVDFTRLEEVMVIVRSREQGPVIPAPGTAPPARQQPASPPRGTTNR